MVDNSSCKNLHLDRLNYMGDSNIYFVTICTADKKPYLRDAEIAAVIIDTMEYRRKCHEIILFCYCIMPDHVHMLLSLCQGYNKSLIDWVSNFKRYASRRVKISYDIAPLWQKNFYDHIVRKDEALINVAEYIVNNPVRKGIVNKWEEYPYSKMIDPLPI